ncbi:MAG: rhodanese-like domain-containing protein, partial [Chloroflexota bacterium]
MTTLHPLTASPIETISTAELRGRLADTDLTVVDVRPLAAYNGWRLAGESRGGHIPGAVAFTDAWLTTVEPAEIERLLADKRVFETRTVVVYGYGPGEANAVATRLGELGHRDVRVYDEGWQAWAADPALPIDSLPNYDRLVHIDWLRAVLAAERPESAPSGPFILFHVNFGVPEEYDEAHIPGALYLDTNWLEDPADWNRRPP